MKRQIQLSSGRSVKVLGPDDDLSRIKDMLKYFIQESPYAHYTFEEDELHDLILVFAHSDLKTHMCVLLLDDVGLAIGLLAGQVVTNPHPLLKDKMALELCWWLEPALRGNVGDDAVVLIDCYEQWARSVGCKRVQLSNLTAKGSKKVGKIYKDMGFVLTEEAWIKELV